jgi:hypothetical protein
MNHIRRRCPTEEDVAATDILAPPDFLTTAVADVN